MNKRQLSERDICTKFITPAIVQAGWVIQSQVRAEVSLTKGRVLSSAARRYRGKAKRADYILYYKPNIPLAVIEAKDNNCAVGDGLQQALEYGESLRLPFVFASNGDGFVLHDGTRTEGEIEQNLSLDQFPSPQTLWARYREWKGLPPEAEPLLLQDFEHLVESHRTRRWNGSRAAYCDRSPATDRYVVRDLSRAVQFIDPESRFPVIVTSSRLLTTGIDAQTCRVIAIDREVGSMAEFKQIVGRGTRIHEDTKKYYFTLVDFRKATNHFADQDFDGDPVQIYEPGPDDPVDPPDPPDGRAEEDLRPRCLGRDRCRTGGVPRPPR